MSEQQNSRPQQDTLASAYALQTQGHESATGPDTRQGVGTSQSSAEPSDSLSRLVRVFLHSNLSIILILFSMILGISALVMTAREEDPQIVVPLADIYVQFPGHTASEVEQLVSTPLERMLYQIDGVEYVYSMSRDDSAIITARFYVGQDRERSLVKLFKKLNENADVIPAGVTGWVMKPVEIDDVPIVSLALTGAQNNSHALRRTAEELVERLAVVPQVSRAFVIGGESRTVTLSLDLERLQAHQLSPAEVVRAVAAANSVLPTGEFSRTNTRVEVVTSAELNSAQQLGELVVGVSDARPVFLKDVATIQDGAEEVRSYSRHGWGPASDWHLHPGAPGTRVGQHISHELPTESGHAGQSTAQGSRELSAYSTPTVLVAISKQKGANSVSVSQAVIREAERLKATLLPDDMQMIITRNSGMVANEKVNELIEALGVAIVIVILLLSIGLGVREALIVSVAVPVVFGLTLAVNLMFGYTINRVTLFALILALGLLVDDPIVDVENIARHFEHRKRASRRIVLEAVAEIRPPLISATLAVIVSFLPMFFITGMMGPYMSPMALNVPVAMLMSMVVAFTITPWLTYQVLKGRYPNDETVPARDDATVSNEPAREAHSHHEAYNPAEVQKTRLYRFFRPLMLPLLKNRRRATAFLAFMAALTGAAMGLGALRLVPLKMLPFDNKNEFLVLVDMPEGSTLERTDALIARLESVLHQQSEVVNYVANVGIPGPIDFNGMVRHYYLRTMPHQAEIRVNFVGKKQRKMQSHGLALRMHDQLDKLASEVGATLRIVELPPGPPVLASLVAEVYGGDTSSYEDLLQAGATVADRMRREPGVIEVDDIGEAPVTRMVFVPDQEKAALAGISVDEIAKNLAIALGGDRAQSLRVDGERRPLSMTFQLPRAARSSPEDLSQITIKGSAGRLIMLSELGRWQQQTTQQTIYHKNLKRVVYVFAECAGRTPAECVIDVLADQSASGSENFVSHNPARNLAGRTFLSNGSGVAWHLADGLHMTFAGEGEWKITLDVFRDLGLAFGAAMVMIYIILVAQTGTFLVPLIVMMAIPLTALGVMPGFYVLSSILSQPVGGYDDPVFFTATAMIGMIALSGIVTRDSIILVDFMQQAVAGGRPLVDAILESRVVRLRPILLTAGAAMFSAVPITLDPIFSGLGWSLIFGLIASTLFTLFVIPVTYWLLYAGSQQVDKNRSESHTLINKS